MEEIYCCEYCPWILQCTFSHLPERLMVSTKDQCFNSHFILLHRHNAGMFYNNGPKTMSFSFSQGILQYTYSPLPKIVKVSLKHINQTNVVETHFNGRNNLFHCGIKCHYEKFYSTGQNYVFLLNIFTQGSYSIPIGPYLKQQTFS